MLAGVFGLVHGAGFANYLKAMFVERIALPLFGFNVGIEVGQLVVLLGIAVVLAGVDRIVSLVADAHPLHTTLTEVTVDAPRRVLHIVIRVFAEDFARAAGSARRPASGAANGPLDANAYLSRTFVVTEGARTLPLRSCGTRRSGELLWLCLETEAPVRLASLMLRDALLCELFDDQLNIVRSLVGTAPRSLLYTRGDGRKPLL